MSTFPSFAQGLRTDPTTRRYTDALGSVHDLEAHDYLTESRLYQRIFASHFGHLAIIFLWSAGNLFHVAWQGNFQEWILNPIKTPPIAHAIFDPHFGVNALQAFTPAGVTYPANISTSGLYHWWYTIGLRSNTDLYNASMFLILCSIAFLYAGWFHSQRGGAPNLAFFKNNESRLNHHLAGLFGTSSVAWAGHLIHVAIPESRGQHVRWDNFTQLLPHPSGLAPILSGNFSIYAENPDSPTHIFSTSEGSGTAILTFLGGFHPQTQSMWLTDIAHHHLAIGIIFIFAGHMYRTSYNWGHSFTELLLAHVPPKGRLSAGHAGLMETLTNSLHMQLGLALAGLGVATSLTAQHMYALPAYAFIASSPVTQASLYVHHQYIAGFLMTGAFAHGAIFFVRDYAPSENEGNVLATILLHKEAIISHLSWVSLFLGFHTLGLYVHNDTCVAFGLPENQLLIDPVFAQIVQAASGKSGTGLDILLSEPTTSASIASSKIWLPGWLAGINSQRSTAFLPIGPGDFLTHHAISLGLHTTTLILVKGALDARESRLLPDKKDFGYSFPCDGPGRGGTCDVSAWDAFYLAVFWQLNTTAWTTFYWHWKHLALWGGNSAAFNEASTYLLGWFRDYLWLYSAPTITGYTPDGMNSQSAWTWMFLFGHLTWATGFMFLISWRGYWQELIETIVWAHERTPIANYFTWNDKPVALSIVQARLVGLTHFATGYILTYAPFLISATTAKTAGMWATTFLATDMAGEIS
jgi:photosystem I P700 chlorophyll a apoprotein A2